MIDDVDRKILSILQENARISNAQIARDVKLAPSGVHERIRKLEEKGIIRGYHVDIDPDKLGYGVTAFMFVKTGDRVGSTNSANQLAKISEVQEVYNIAGEDCYLVKLRCADNQDLGRLLREKFGAITSIRSTRTSIVMDTVKEGGALPVDGSR